MRISDCSSDVCSSDLDAFPRGQASPRRAAGLESPHPGDDAMTAQITQGTPIAGDTHEVLNQPPALEDYNLFATDHALQNAAAVNGAGWANDRLSAYGAKLGAAETIEQGRLAHKKR